MTLRRLRPFHSQFSFSMQNALHEGIPRGYGFGQSPALRRQSQPLWERLHAPDEERDIQGIGSVDFISHSLLSSSSFSPLLLFLKSLRFLIFLPSSPSSSSSSSSSFPLHHHLFLSIIIIIIFSSPSSSSSSFPPHRHHHHPSLLSRLPFYHCLARMLSVPFSGIYFRHLPIGGGLPEGAGYGGKEVQGRRQGTSHHQISKRLLRKTSNLK